MTENTGGSARELLAAARDCLAYVPGVGDVGEWRQTFDRLADLRREADRSLIRSDRDRLAAIVAEIAVLAANSADVCDRLFLAEIGGLLARFAADDDHFRADGNFARGDHG
jgi:hypothetical protein